MKPSLREVSHNTPNNPVEACTDTATYPVYVTSNEASKIDPHMGKQPI